MNREEEDKDLGRHAVSIGGEKTFREMIRKLYNKHNWSVEELAKDNETSIEHIEFILTNDDSDLKREIWWED